MSARTPQEHLDAVLEEIQMDLRKGKITRSQAAAAKAAVWALWFRLRGRL